MAKVELSIALEKNKAYFAVGERIRGRVLVRVNSDCECQGLRLRVFWRVDLSQDSATEFQFHLFRGRFKAGERRAYPFEFTAPAGPLSHIGELLKLRWCIAAEADIPFTMQIQTKTEFTLFLSSEDDTVVSQGEDEHLSNLASAVGRRASSLTAPEVNRPKFFIYEEELKSYGPLFLIGLLGIFLVGQFIQFGDTFNFLVNFFLGALFSVFGVSLASYSWRPLLKALAGSKFGGVELDLKPSPFLAPNMSSQLELRFCPKRRLTINRAWATLRCVEIVDKLYTRKYEQKRLSGVVYEGDFSICDTRTCEVGEPVQMEKSFQVPANAPFSFFATGSQLMWTLDVNIETESGLAWREKRTVIVYPQSIVNGLMAANAPEMKVLPKVQQTATGPLAQLEAKLEAVRIAAQSGDRKQITKALCSSMFSFDLKVEKVIETPRRGALPGRDGGHTIFGKPVGLEDETVAVQFDQSFNDETLTLRTGDEVLIKGVLQGWNSKDEHALFAAQA